MNKTLFSWHSKMALLAMLPLVVISLTGSILTFKDEIDSLLLPAFTLNETREARLPVDNLIARINSQLPDHELATWEMFDDHYTADRIYFFNTQTDVWTKAFFNPYTGEVLSEPVSLHHELTDFLLSLHYTLLLKNTGLGIASVVSLLFIFLGVSGIILYRKFWTRLFLLRWNKRLVIYFSDLHKMVGILASPVLLTLGVTGAYFNIAEFVDEAFLHEHGGITNPPYNRQVSIDQMLRSSEARIDSFKPTYIVFPYMPERDFMVIGAVDTANPLISNYASGVIFDRNSGAFKSLWDVRTQGFVPVMLDTFRRLHFGNFAGIYSKLLWCIAGLMPLILSVTGFTLWWIRREKRKTKQLKTLRVLEQDA